MMDRRKYVTPHKDLQELGAVPTSRGECTFCNEPADVYSIPDGKNNIPIIVHSGEACEKLIARCELPGATACSDQLHGMYDDKPSRSYPNQ